jgi:hypothetical protein
MLASLLIVSDKAFKFETVAANRLFQGSSG